MSVIGISGWCAELLITIESGWSRKNHGMGAAVVYGQIQPALHAKYRHAEVLYLALFIWAWFTSTNCPTG